MSVHAGDLKRDTLHETQKHVTNPHIVTGRWGWHFWILNFGSYTTTTQWILSILSNMKIHGRVGWYLVCHGSPIFLLIVLLSTHTPDVSSLGFPLLSTLNGQSFRSSNSQGYTHTHTHTHTHTQASTHTHTSQYKQFSNVPRQELPSVHVQFNWWTTIYCRHHNNTYTTRTEHHNRQRAWIAHKCQHPPPS